MSGPKPLSLNRIWSNTDRETGCWIWLGATTRHYGVLTSSGHLLYAHRVAWELTNGPIPASLHVLHRCDNPPCINPEHLFLGTPTDNLRDAKAKGRTSHGERRSNHKLTDTEVLRIRELRAAGMRVDQIAATTKAARGTVGKALRRKTWTHI